MSPAKTPYPKAHSHGLEPARRRALVAEFLAWFDREARDLPWRRTRDPYAIWLSEVMLQQTRVDTVIPYYQRFLQEYPTLHALAEAPLDDVLLRWSGLGYYRRARQLHLAARDVVSRYGGHLPRTAIELGSLAGVGEYTAGAVASIAFDEPAALVDGNVIRVLSRIEGLDEDMRSLKGRARVWAIARELVPTKRAGAFNQALMELGSQVCTPRAPGCDRCPVRAHCVARASGRAEKLPNLSAKKAPRAESLFAAVVFADDCFVFAQRRDDGLYAGMWEPPTAPDRALVLAGLVAAGLPSELALESRGSVKHVLSHKRLAVEVASATLSRSARPKSLTVGAGFSENYQKLALRRPEDVALSTLARKVLKAAGVCAQVACFLVATPAPARAQEPQSAADAGELGPVELERYREFSRGSGHYGRVLATVAGGRGVRFNNPFRLGTQLGQTGESLSLTAPYVDLGLGVAFGDPFGLQHGPNVHASFATEGVSQSAVSLTYMVLHRSSSPWLTYLRGGAAFLTAPDLNVGGEVAAGIGGFFTGALGATAELVGDLFYGAGTYDTRYTVVPVVSLQLGLIVDLEVLP